jgi:amidase
MALETHSNLFGRTVNPHNVSLTSGGSTGGEGALIAMCGSVLGIGTDIGGSIRVPSGFCGIYGLKPSVGRIPHSGLSGLHDGMQNIIGSVGPMARCVEDLDLFCRAALAKKPWNHEPSLITMPWKMGYESPKTLTIGVIWNDGVVQPHPPVVRALKEAVSSLERSGHTIITWDTSLHEALINTLNELYFLDGGKEYHEMLAAGRETAVPILEWVLNSKALRHYDVEETWKVSGFWCSDAIQLTQTAEFST